MDTRSIDEFESLFEAAVRPSVSIEPMEWSRVLVALDGSSRADAALQAGLVLAAREQLPLVLLAPVANEERRPALQQQLEASLAAAEARGVAATGSCEAGDPREQLLSALAEPTSLLALPTPFGSGQAADSLGTVVDALLTASDTPMLLCKQTLSAPEKLFQHLLVYVPGGFEVGPHFSIPFGLVAPSGQLDLVHIVNQAEIERVASALELDPSASTTDSHSLAHALELQMQQLLGEAVARVVDMPYSCRSRVATGAPLAWLALNLLNERNSLLVVDSETRKGQPVPPEAYAIIKEIAGVPILIL